jgi:hypothetical protein
LFSFPWLLFTLRTKHHQGNEAAAWGSENPAIYGIFAIGVFACGSAVQSVRYGGTG